jgi:nucleoside-triphosphatase THEP1
MAITTPLLTIITGESGVGKTTVCQALIELARQRNLHVEGVISPAIIIDGMKTGILVENAATGEQRKLACLNKTFSQEGLQTSHWLFNSDAMAWGSQILDQSGDCDLLVVDELGPLELERQQGWVEGITAIDRMNYRMAVVVIRPELIKRAKDLWPNAEVYTVAKGISHGEIASILFSYE